MDPLTVGALKRAIASLPDDMPIVVRSTEEHEDGDIETCCTLIGADTENGCYGPTFLALTGSNVDDDGNVLRLAGEDVDEDDEPLALTVLKGGGT